MLRSIAVVAKPDAAAASHIRLNDEADGPYRSDYGDLVTAEDINITAAKSLFAVDYPTPPSAHQRSMIPRKKTSKIRLGETSDIHNLTHKRSHVAFMQKSEQEGQDMDTQQHGLPSPTTSRRNGFRDQTPEPPETSPISPSTNRGTELKWIHRDNLAMIEKEELQEIDKMGHSQAQNGLRIQTDHAQVRHNEYHDELVTPISKRLRVDSPLNGTVEMAEGAPSPTNGGTKGQSAPLKNSNVRKDSRNVSSRIPISVSTPSPDRPTTAQTRNGNIRLVPNPSGSIQYSKPRQLRTGEDISLTASNQQPASASYTRSPLSATVSGTPFAERSEEITPLRVRPLSRDATSFHSRQGSISRNISSTQKHNRTPSGRSIRPLSSSARPRTPLNRPEGEAPWIADMYKPDPMLPQEEQIIPTHAKRLGLHIKNSPKSDSMADSDVGLQNDDEAVEVVEVTTEEYNATTTANPDFEAVQNEHAGISGQRKMSPNLQNTAPQQPVQTPHNPPIESLENITLNIPTPTNPAENTAATPLPLAQQLQQKQPTPHPPTTPKAPTTLPPRLTETCTGTDGPIPTFSSPLPPAQPIKQLSSQPSTDLKLHGGYKIMPTVHISPADAQIIGEADLSTHPALRSPSSALLALSSAQAIPGPTSSRSQSRAQSFKGRYPYLGPAQTQQPLSRKDSGLATVLPPGTQTRAEQSDVVVVQQEGGGARVGKPVRVMDVEEAVPARGKTERKGCAGCCVVM